MSLAASAMMPARSVRTGAPAQGAALSSALPAEDAAPERPADPVRLRALIDTQYDFVWRSLRRLGVGSTDVDDGAQQVFWVVARKLSAIEEGCERAFLFSTAMRVASDARRARARRREVSEDDAMSERCDSSPSPEDIAERRQARALLDEVLDAMSMELRAVFVLYELEEVATPEIARMLGLPIGTATSRLRRAREEFQAIAARLRARAARGGGGA